LIGILICFVFSLGSLAMLGQRERSN
jgi:hypothetical protein